MVESYDPPPLGWQKHHPLHHKSIRAPIGGPFMIRVRNKLRTLPLLKRLVEPAFPTGLSNRLIIIEKKYHSALPECFTLLRTKKPVPRPPFKIPLLQRSPTNSRLPLRKDDLGHFFYWHTPKICRSNSPDNLPPNNTFPHIIQ